MNVEENSQDFGNIVLFEHINLEINDVFAATKFYCDFLGLTRDPFRNGSTLATWINVGYQQLHLPFSIQSQNFRGIIGILVPNIKDLIDRMDANEFQISKEKPLLSIKGVDFENGKMFIGPFGNKFFIHEAIHSPPFRGSLGIDFMELPCSRGSSSSIGNFYKNFLGALVEKKELSREGDVVQAIDISIGQSQHLLFIESDNVPAYDGHHLCIYIHNFSSVFKKLEKRGLIFMNRLQSDQCGTLTQALEKFQFRFKDIIDEESGKVVYTLEHEVRSMFHPSYMRPLVNRSGNVGFYCNQ